MTPKRRKIVIICLIIFAVSLATVAVSTVIQIIHNGWDNLSFINYVPFIGITAAMISVLVNLKNDKDKK